MFSLVFGLQPVFKTYYRIAVSAPTSETFLKLFLGGILSLRFDLCFRTPSAYRLLVCSRVVLLCLSSSQFTYIPRRRFVLSLPLSLFPWIFFSFLSHIHISVVGSQPTVGNGKYDGLLVFARKIINSFILT